MSPSVALLACDSAIRGFQEFQPITPLIRIRPPDRQIMSTMDELVSPPLDAVPSVLANLDRMPLGEMIASPMVLRESVNRVLPTLEIQQVSVAAFNSTI